MGHEFKCSPKTNKQKTQSCPCTLNHWPLPAPLHNCARAAPRAAALRAPTRSWCSSGRTVPALPGTALTSSTAAGMVPRCGFGTEPVLVTQRCFTCCWAEFAQRQNLFFLPTPAPQQVVGWGRVRSWEGTWPGQLVRGMLHAHGIALSTKSWGKKEEEGTFGLIMFVFPSNHYAWWSPACLEMAKRLPADGKERVVPYCALVAHTALLHLLNCL